MEDDKEELQEEVEHHQKMLKIYRRNLRTLEEQAATLGLIAPPAVHTQIMDATEQIQFYEKELARVKTEAAKDKLPVEILEYQAALAEVWKDGRPTFLGKTRLELLRLRLGIKPPTAAIMESAVRKELAHEVFQSISSIAFKVEKDAIRLSRDDETELLKHLGKEIVFSTSPLWVMVGLDRLKIGARSVYEKIATCIRLDKQIAVEMFYSATVSLDYKVRIVYDASIDTRGNTYEPDERLHSLVEEGNYSPFPPVNFSVFERLIEYGCVSNVDIEDFLLFKDFTEEVNEAYWEAQGIDPPDFLRRFPPEY